MTWFSNAMDASLTLDSCERSVRIFGKYPFSMIQAQQAFWLCTNRRWIKQAAQLARLACYALQSSLLHIRQPHTQSRTSCKSHTSGSCWRQCMRFAGSTKLSMWLANVKKRRSQDVASQSSELSLWFYSLAIHAKRKKTSWSSLKKWVLAQNV